MSTDEDVNKLKHIAQEIEAYIEDKQDAADTLEGILHWWIFRQRLEEAEQNVKQAIEYLLSEGKLTKRKMLDGKEIYYRK